MTLGQLEVAHLYVWTYVIIFDGQGRGEAMLKIPSKAWDVEVEHIYPSLYNIAEGNEIATVKPCLAVIVNAKQWQKAVGNA